MLRAEVAEMLRVDKMTVRRLERRGELHPIVLEGVHYFGRKHVFEVLKARQHGQRAAAFRLFEEGKEPVQVVIELDADPDLVHALWEGYQRLLGCWVVQGPKSLRAWEATYGLGELTPRKLLKALELVASNPPLRAELLAVG